MAPPRNLRRISAHKHSYSRAGLEAREIAALFGAVEIGEVLIYDDILAITGIDLRQKDYLIPTIKDLAYDEYQIILKPHPGIGYERLSESGKVDFAESKLQAAHRASLRTAKVFRAVDHEQLSPLQQHRKMALESLNASLTLFTHHEQRQAYIQGKTELPALPAFDATIHTDLFRSRKAEPQAL